MSARDNLERTTEPVAAANGPENRPSPSGSGSPTFLEALLALASTWRRTIFWTAGAALLISTVVAFLLSPKFKSTASVFPAENTDILSGLQAGGIPSLMRAVSPASGLFRTDMELDRYTAILNSGRVLGEVIRRFDLIRVYDITSYPMERTTKELLSNVDISAEPEGYLSITVYDEDPQRAADIANFFVEMLDRVNREINAQNAHATRVFIEDRYQKNLADLAAAEDSLRAFQLRFGIIAMPEQTEETVKAGVSLAAELASKEVELSVLRRMVAKDHPSIVQKRIEVEELRKKIAELNNDAGGRDDEMRMMVPYRQIPDLGVAYVRRYREVQIQSKILEFLTPLYEQAKVEEKKESPSVIVLDRAGPAERKSSPKRSLIMLAGTLLGLIGAFVFGAASTRWADLRARDARLYHIVTDLLQGGRDDLRRFFTRRQDKGSS